MTPLDPKNIDLIVVHASDSAFGDVEQIRDWHVRGNGWGDVGYHYVILNGVRRSGDPYKVTIDGMIEEGRPTRWIGAHCKAVNARSLGVCLVGGKPTPRQLRSLGELCAALMARHRIGDIAGHRDFAATDCPGWHVRPWARGRGLIV